MRSAQFLPLGIPNAGPLDGGSLVSAMPQAQGFRPSKGAYRPQCRRPHRGCLWRIRSQDWHFGAFFIENFRRTPAAVDLLKGGLVRLKGEEYVADFNLVADFLQPLLIRHRSTVMPTLGIIAVAKCYASFLWDRRTFQPHVPQAVCFCS